MPIADKILILIAAAFLMNLPLGYMRQNARKYSFKWLFYIHLSIPFIILIRFKLGISNWFIPFSLGSAVAGQLVGGHFNRQPGRQKRQEP